MTVESESAGWQTGAGNAFCTGNSNGDYSTFAAVDKFRAAMLEAGLPYRGEIVPNGKLHCVHIEGDKHRVRNGWYVLYANGIPAGSFGSWKLGVTHNWCAKDRNLLNPFEQSDYQRRIKEATRHREEEQAHSRSAAKDKAQSIWRLAQPVESHPYLSQKRMGAYGIREFKGSLVIPLRDIQGAIHSLQFIGAEGNKRFLKGGAISGHYHAIGKYQGVLCICEGYAIGATIHQATGHAVAVAFNAGNLRSVALALRAKFPDARIIACADSDPVGIAKGREAAQAVQGCIALPDFKGVGHGG
jgi:putative DNA primase/helicase